MGSARQAVAMQREPEHELPRIFTRAFLQEPRNTRKKGLAQEERNNVHLLATALFIRAYLSRRAGTNSHELRIFAEAGLL